MAMTWQMALFYPVSAAGQVSEVNTFAWDGHATHCTAVALRLSVTNKCKVHLGSTVPAYSTGERGCR
jgi:hypothetical protein